uniref:Glycoside hydrolase family 3 C-terminal domain-containing protein n=1 Tax=Vitis vinifera TaxID=29760 RepID=F6HE25_VITVI
MGCGDVLCHNDTYVYKAVEAAKHADTTIIVVGITDVSIGTEDKDRVDLLLPGYQTHLVNQIAKATTAPIILVVCVVTVVALSTFLLLGTTPGLNPSCGLVFRVRKVETPLQMSFMGSTILEEDCQSHGMKMVMLACCP